MPIAYQRVQQTEEAMEMKTGLGSKADESHVFRSAQDATDKEHHLTLSAAIKLYPKAVAWSVVMSASLIMDGYDLKLIGSLFAQPAFQKAYGHEGADGKYQISAPWQSGLNNGSNVGQMLGLLIAGVIVERFGFRKTMMGALIVVPCLIFIQFFATGLPQLQVGQILLGMLLSQYTAGSDSLIAVFQGSLLVSSRRYPVSMPWKWPQSLFAPSSQPSSASAGSLDNSLQHAFFAVPSIWMHPGLTACLSPSNGFGQYPCS